MHPETGASHTYGSAHGAWEEGSEGLTLHFRELEGAGEVCMKDTEVVGFWFRVRRWPGTSIGRVERLCG